MKNKYFAQIRHVENEIFNYLNEYYRDSITIDYYTNRVKYTTSGLKIMYTIYENISLEITVEYNLDIEQIRILSNLWSSIKKEVYNLAKYDTVMFSSKKLKEMVDSL